MGHDIRQEGGRRRLEGCRAKNGAAYFKEEGKKVKEEEEDHKKVAAEEEEEEEEGKSPLMCGWVCKPRASARSGPKSRVDAIDYKKLLHSVS